MPLEPAGRHKSCIRPAGGPKHFLIGPRLQSRCGATPHAPATQGQLPVRGRPASTGGVKGRYSLLLETSARLRISCSPTESSPLGDRLMRWKDVPNPQVELPTPGLFHRGVRAKLTGAPFPERPPSAPKAAAIPAGFEQAECTSGAFDALAARCSQNPPTP